MQDLVLLPRPRRLIFKEGTHSGVKSDETESAGVRAHVDPSAIRKAQGYRLTVSADQVQIVAHDESGARYGAATLRQIERQVSKGSGLPCLEVEDWPDFQSRAVMLDISRDKVPTLDTLCGLVDILSEWKINQLQLYTEHTFAYRNHEAVWRDASPMTGEDIERLDAYCRERCVELIPNQNSFGHLERWLKHEDYHELAAAPGGYEREGRRRPASTLNPLDPDSIKLLSELYEELLPHFSSRLFNVGCDETFDLCIDRCREACREKGGGRVYLDFLLRVHSLVASHGRTMMFWSDIIHEHPELIEEIPKDAMALEWGYVTDHPYAEHCARLARAGLPFYVCPGTSTWNSLVGRTDIALANLRSAAQEGLKHGASGYMITDWGDNGHMQFLPVSYLSFACGAALSWSQRANLNIDLPRALDLHAFKDSAGVMGGLARDLGNAYQKSHAPIPRNASLPGLILAYPEELPRSVAEESLEGFHQMEQQIVSALSNLSDARMERPEAELIQSEFRVNGALALHACRLGRAMLDSGAPTIPTLAESDRRQLAAELTPIIADYRELWLARNRPGGLNDSAGRLERLLSLYSLPGTD